jgi:hypothetical protein
MRAIFVITAAFALAGCASTTPTREVSYGYAIFDIQAGPDIGTARIADAVKVALQKQMSSVQIINGVPPSPLPEKAPRFQLVSPFKGSGLAALAGASAVQIASCEGAVLTANGRDTSMGRYGEATTFFACLMPYQSGYALNVYTTFSKASGAFNASVLAATLMRPLTGDSSQFIPRTITTMVEGVKQTGVTVTMVEAYP